MSSNLYRVPVVSMFLCALCLGCGRDLSRRSGSTGGAPPVVRGGSPGTGGVPPGGPWGSGGRPGGVSGSGGRRKVVPPPAGVRARAVLKGHAAGIGSIAFSPDGKVLATGDGQGEIRLWDVGTGKERATLDGHDAWVHSLAFSPDGKTLASGSGIPPGRPREQGVKLWDVETGKPAGGQTGRTGYVYAVAYSPDGKTLAYGNASGFVKLLDAATLKERASLEVRAAVTSVVFSPDGKVLATGDLAGKVRAWDPATGKELPAAEAKGRFAFLPSGKVAYTQRTKGGPPVLDDGLWESLVAAHGGGSVVALSPDGKLAATGGLDRVVKLWDLAPFLKH